MTLDVSPEVEARLLRIAQHEGTSVETLLFATAQSLYQDDLEFHAGVQQGIEQADRGEFVDEQEVKALWNRLLHQAQGDRRLPERASSFVR